jgi:group I intron endonuclease
VLNGDWAFGGLILIFTFAMTLSQRLGKSKCSTPLIHNSMNNNIGIYLLTSPDGRHYVGASTNLKKRKSQFFNSSERCFAKNYSGLVDEIKLYPRNLWMHEVLVFCGKDDLDRLEQMWIRLYRSTDPEFGYNKALGGKGTLGVSHYGEANHMFGKKLSEEHKKKLRESNLGKKRSVETRKKMSKSNARTMRGRFGADNNSAKAINQYDKQGNFIRRWGSIIDAARELGANQKAIIHCLRGKTKTSFGHIWRYADADNNN